MISKTIVGLAAIAAVALSLIAGPSAQAASASVQRMASSQKLRVWHHHHRRHHHHHHHMMMHH
jgi:hypothetical protein